MKKAYPYLIAAAGLSLVLYITNDFTPLLIEYLFDISDFKLPIRFSEAGWEYKYAMMDAQPRFDNYQTLFMGVGFFAMMAGLFQVLPQRVSQGITIGLIVSAALVYTFQRPVEYGEELSTIQFLVNETPLPFMKGQLIAGILLLPAAFSVRFRSLTGDIALSLALILALALFIVCSMKSTVTLRYAVFPLLLSLVPFAYKAYHLFNTQLRKKP